MDTFRWITVVVSTILGLGIARLLTTAVALFHSRRRATLDWVPIVWAACVFVQQIGFWWSLEELSLLVPKWTLAGFLLLVGLVLALFLAAALILPAAEVPDGRLEDFFQEDGRFALLALAGFNLCAVIVNGIYWKEALLSIGSAANVALAVLALTAFGAPRPARAAATAAYAPLIVWFLVTQSPSSY